MLPAELVESLNQTYFLHLLLNDREKVVPPGKSLLSMMIHANFQLPHDDTSDDKKHPHAALVHRVKEAAHKAFWREVCVYIKSVSYSYFCYIGYRESFIPNTFRPITETKDSIFRPLPGSDSPLPSQPSYISHSRRSSFSYFISSPLHSQPPQRHPHRLARTMRSHPRRRNTLPPIHHLLPNPSIS